MDVVRKISLDNVTIGVVTALPVEYAAVIEMLGCYETVTANDKQYKVGTVQLKNNDGSHTVAVCQLSDMGTNDAAAGTTAMLKDCKNIQAVVMCGIAGAVPSPDKNKDHVHLGDIVVSGNGGVVQYDNEYVEETGTRPRPRYYSPSVMLLDAARELEALEILGQRPWEDYITQALEKFGDKGEGQGWKRPPDTKDLLREFSRTRPIDHLVKLARKHGAPKKWFRYGIIPHPDESDRRNGMPKVFHGVIASANKLQKSSQNRDHIKDLCGAKAIEMEGAGVATAARYADSKFIVVRGTCDYCNSEKNDDWHMYAALIASAYTRALLEVTPPPRLIEDDVEITNSVSLQSEANFRPMANEKGYLQLIEENGRHKINELKDSLDTWELRKAAELAEGLDSWLGKYKEDIPEELVKEGYAILARVAINESSKESGKSGSRDLTLVKYYIRKAKGV